jgi:NAD-dependent dihydropyrimidine dehydrogenase PreA subunit
MAKRITVVVSQGQSANPQKRQLEEDIVANLLGERGMEVTVIPHLYDLAPESTGMLCLSGISGDMIVLSWLFPRAAHWTLDRGGVRGHFGATLLKADEDDEDDDEQDQSEVDTADDGVERVGARDLPARTIYHLDLRTTAAANAYLEEIRRIAREATVETVSLLGWTQPAAKPPAPAQPASPPVSFGFGPTPLVGAPAPTSGSPAPQSAIPNPQSAIAHNPQSDIPNPQSPLRVDETPARRWYPVIDYSRCTNCMECIDFCLFGVYGVDGLDTILVEQPDNCRKGCPACSRVCPENAIIFPQHKSPAIAGSPDENAGGLKIDLSQLFGAPNAIEIAAQERDVELVATGRDAVGLSVGIPKRQSGQPQGPKDDLDKLMDQLDLDF